MKCNLSVNGREWYYDFQNDFWRNGGRSRTMYDFYRIYGDRHIIFADITG